MTITREKSVTSASEEASMGISTVLSQSESGHGESNSQNVEVLTTKPSHQSMRASRDELIDILGLGYTWPVTDQVLPEGDIKVAYDTRAHIPIRPSQRDSEYHLYYKGERVADSGIEKGNDELLMLPTHPIVKDRIYTVLAKKNNEEENQAFLNYTVNIKVGLDDLLEAEILNAEILDTSLENIYPESARIIFYGETVRVEVRNTQEGVLYELVSVNDPEQPFAQDTLLSEQVVGLGVGQNIQLQSFSIYEDTDLYIRATKKFIDGEREDEVIRLKTVLPLKVRANTIHNLLLGETKHFENPIVQFDAFTGLHIQDSQTSVSYQVFERTITDELWVFNVDEVAESRVLSAHVPDREEGVKVLFDRPPQNHIWSSAPAGFTPLGEPKNGNGEILSISLANIQEDKLYIVRAIKTHTEKRKEIQSSVQLIDSAFVLARPNHNQPLTLNFSETKQELQVGNGQPGVFYDFNIEGAEEALSLPAYFQQWADSQTRSHTKTDKGIDEIRLNVDFVLTADNDPETPQLDIETIPFSGQLTVEGRKAMTGVPGYYERVPLPTPVFYRVEDVSVLEGATTIISVADSQEEARYQLFSRQRQAEHTDFTPIGEAISGNNGTLELPTEALYTNTELELHVHYPAQNNMTLKYEYNVEINVQAGDL